MKRGEIVVVALQGDYGKSRPALIVQSDLFATLPSVIILPITSDLRDAPLYRLAIGNTPATGLSKPSQIMVDKPQTIPRSKVRQIIGKLEDSEMVAVNRTIALLMGLA